MDTAPQPLLPRAETTAPAEPAARHVAIVGLMGSGKSTIGRLVATALGRPMRDSDPGIEAERGMTVRQLRDELGEAAMHEIEVEQLLTALADAVPSVVCPAASVVDDADGLGALADPGVVVVWLAASPEVVARRFGERPHRPSFGPDPGTFLARQAADRDLRYRALAAIEVSTDREPPDAVAHRVLTGLAAVGIVPG